MFEFKFNSSTTPINNNILNDEMKMETNYRTVECRILNRSPLWKCLQSWVLVANTMEDIKFVSNGFSRRVYTGYTNTGRYRHIITIVIIAEYCA